MNMLAATLGVLLAGGGLSLCGLCDTNRALQRGAAYELMGVADSQTPARSGFVAGISNVAPVAAPATKTVTFKIQGMTCGGCVFGVRKVLSRLRGVSKANVTYEDSRAVVTYDPAMVTVGQMTAAIKTLGYSATVVASKESR